MKNTSVKYKYKKVKPQIQVNKNTIDSTSHFLIEKTTPQDMYEDPAKDPAENPSRRKQTEAETENKFRLKCKYKCFNKGPG